MLASTLAPLAGIEGGIFDVDGTTVRSLPFIRSTHRETIGRVLRQHDEGDRLPKIDDYADVMEPFLGLGLPAELMGELQTLAPELAAHTKVEKLVKLLKEVQLELADQYLVAYDGLVELLAHFGRTKRSFAFFSSGLAYLVHQTMATIFPADLGLRGLHRDDRLTEAERTAKVIVTLQGYFGIPRVAVVVREDVGDEPKPSPRGTRLALQRLGLLPGAAVYYGDDTSDMESARLSGIWARIGVRHPPNPLRTRKQLVKAGATHIITSLAEARALLAG